LKWTVQQAIDAGYSRQELRDTDAVAQTLWASVHGVIALEIAKGCDEWVQWRPLAERSAMMLDLTLRGLAKSAPPSKDVRTMTPGNQEGC
jgi:hypothetical protein